MIYQNLTELVGRTPLLNLRRMASLHGTLAQVVAKVETFNPGGSVKDRVALHMIEDAEARGLLRPGSVIIEPTSGNTGVGLAWISRVKGYEAIIVMPDSMSVERQSLLRASGARLVLTPGAQGMKGAISEAGRHCQGGRTAGRHGTCRHPGSVHQSGQCRSARTDHRRGNLARHRRTSGHLCGWRWYGRYAHRYSAHTQETQPADKDCGGGTGRQRSS